MNHPSSSAFLILSILLSIGCGSESRREVSNIPSVSAADTAGTPAPANAAGNQASSSVAVENQTAPGSSNPLAAAREKQLNRLRKQAEEQDVPKLDIEDVLRQSTRPAPENSEFSVALTDILVERRTFLQHPTLAKAEKVTEGTTKTLHIFTKDGRSFKVPGDAIESLSTATSVEILTAAGIAAPPGEKKGEKPRARKN